MKAIRKWWDKICRGLKAQANSEQYAKTGRFINEDPEFPGTFRPGINSKAKKVKTTAVAVIVAATTVATISAGDKDKASGITTGQTNPYGGVSAQPSTNPYGWMLRGWNFLSWGNVWDSFEGWSTGAPKITVEPNPPASDDASSK